MSFCLKVYSRPRSKDFATIWINSNMTPKDVIQIIRVQSSLLKNCDYGLMIAKSGNKFKWLDDNEKFGKIIIDEEDEIFTQPYSKLMTVGLPDQSCTKRKVDIRSPIEKVVKELCFHYKIHPYEVWGVFINARGENILLIPNQSISEQAPDAERIYLKQYLFPDNLKPDFLSPLDIYILQYRSMIISEQFGYEAEDQIFLKGKSWYNSKNIFDEIPRSENSRKKELQNIFSLKTFGSVSFKVRFHETVGEENLHSNEKLKKLVILKKALFLSDIDSKNNQKAIVPFGAIKYVGIRDEFLRVTFGSKEWHFISHRSSEIDVIICQLMKNYNFTVPFEDFNSDIFLPRTFHSFKNQIYFLPDKIYTTDDLICENMSVLASKYSKLYRLQKDNKNEFSEEYSLTQISINTSLDELGNTFKSQVDGGPYQIDQINFAIEEAKKISSSEFEDQDDYLEELRKSLLKLNEVLNKNTENLEYRIIKKALKRGTEPDENINDIRKNSSLSYLNKNDSSNNLSMKNDPIKSDLIEQKNVFEIDSDDLSKQKDVFEIDSDDLVKQDDSIKSDLIKKNDSIKDDLSKQKDVFEIDSDDLIKQDDSIKTDLIKQDDSIKTDLIKQNDSIKTDLIKQNDSIKTDLIKQNDSIKTDLIKQDDSIKTDLIKQNDSIKTDLIKQDDSIKTDLIKQKDVFEIDSDDLVKQDDSIKCGLINSDDLSKKNDSIKTDLIKQKDVFEIDSDDLIKQDDSIKSSLINSNNEAEEKNKKLPQNSVYLFSKEFNGSDLINLNSEKENSMIKSEQNEKEESNILFYSSHEQNNSDIIEEEEEECDSNDNSQFENSVKEATIKIDQFAKTEKDEEIAITKSEESAINQTEKIVKGEEKNVQNFNLFGPQQKQNNYRMEIESTNSFDLYSETEEDMYEEDEEDEEEDAYDTTGYHYYSTLGNTVIYSDMKNEKKENDPLAQFDSMSKRKANDKEGNNEKQCILMFPKTDQFVTQNFIINKNETNESEMDSFEKSSTKVENSDLQSKLNQQEIQECMNKNEAASNTIQIVKVGETQNDESLAKIDNSKINDIKDNQAGNNDIKQIENDESFKLADDLNHNEINENEKIEGNELLETVEISNIKEISKAEQAESLLKVDNSNHNETNENDKIEGNELLETDEISNIKEISKAEQAESLLKVDNSNHDEINKNEQTENNELITKIDISTLNASDYHQNEISKDEQAEINESLAINDDSAHKEIDSSQIEQTEKSELLETIDSSNKEINSNQKEVNKSEQAETKEPLAIPNNSSLKTIDNNQTEINTNEQTDINCLHALVDSSTLKTIDNNQIEPNADDKIESAQQSKTTDNSNLIEIGSDQIEISKYGQTENNASIQTVDSKDANKIYHHLNENEQKENDESIEITSNSSIKTMSTNQNEIEQKENDNSLERIENSSIKAMSANQNENNNIEQKENDESIEIAGNTAIKAMSTNQNEINRIEQKENDNSLKMINNMSINQNKAHENEQKEKDESIEIASNSSVKAMNTNQNEINKIEQKENDESIEISSNASIKTMSANQNEIEQKENDNSLERIENSNIKTMSANQNEAIKIEQKENDGSLEIIDSTSKTMKSNQNDINALQSMHQIEDHSNNDTEESSGNLICSPLIKNSQKSKVMNQVFSPTKRKHETVSKLTFVVNENDEEEEEFDSLISSEANRKSRTPTHRRNESLISFQNRNQECLSDFPVEIYDKNKALSMSRSHFIKQSMQKSINESSDSTQKENMINRSQYNEMNDMKWNNQTLTNNYNINMNSPDHYNGQNQQMNYQSPSQSLQPNQFQMSLQSHQNQQKLSQYEMKSIEQNQLCLNSPSQSLQPNQFQMSLLSQQSHQYEFHSPQHQQQQQQFLHQMSLQTSQQSMQIPVPCFNQMPSQFSPFNQSIVAGYPLSPGFYSPSPAASPATHIESSPQITVKVGGGGSKHRKNKKNKKTHKKRKESSDSSLSYSDYDYNESDSNDLSLSSESDDGCETTDQIIEKIDSSIQKVVNLANSKKDVTKEIKSLGQLLALLERKFNGSKKGNEIRKLIKKIKKSQNQKYDKKSSLELADEVTKTINSYFAEFKQILNDPVIRKSNDIIKFNNDDKDADELSQSLMQLQKSLLSCQNNYFVDQSNE